MTQEFKVGTKVKHKTHGFEGVVERKGFSYATVRITKGVHPYNSLNATYEADFANLLLVEAELEVGSYVAHTRYGFKGVVESHDTFNAHVRITEGVHPFESSKKTYDASPSLLKVIDSPQAHFEKLLKEYKTKVEKAEADAKVKAEELAKAKADAKEKAEEVYDMEIEMNGMIIRTDFETFNKIVATYK